MPSIYDIEHNLDDYLKDGGKLTSKQWAMLWAIIMKANETGWKVSFEIRENWLETHSGLTHSQITNARRGLVSKGLVTFVPGKYCNGKREQSSYSLTDMLIVKNYFLSKNVSDIQATSKQVDDSHEAGDNKELESYQQGALSVTQSETANLTRPKTKDLDRHKNKKSNIVISFVRSKLLVENSDYVIQQFKTCFGIELDASQRAQISELIVPYNRLQLDNFLRKTLLNCRETDKRFAYFSQCLRNSSVVAMPTNIW